MKELNSPRSFSSLEYLHNLSRDLWMGIILEKNKLNMSKLEEAPSQEFCCVQVNSVLESLLSTLTRTQNAPAELRSWKMRNEI